MYRVFKSTYVEGMTAEKSYSYSKHYLLLSPTRTVICQVPCDQIEGTSGKGTAGWIEEIQEPEYDEKVFTLTPDQVKKFEDWRKSKDEENVYVGAAGGAYTFCFTPTGIGTIAVVNCADGSEIDITNEDEFN